MFNRLSCQLLCFFELTKINNHWRQFIIHTRVPRCELLCTTEFSQSLLESPFAKKPSPAERGMRLRKVWLDGDSPLAITGRF
jgi:hypothetical protein